MQFRGWPPHLVFGRVGFDDEQFGPLPARGSVLEQDFAATA